PVGFMRKERRETMTRSTSSRRLRHLAYVLPLLAAAALGFSLAGRAAPPAPGIEVRDTSNGALVPLGRTVAYGPTPVATPGPKVFSVRNTGDSNLLVSEAITVPQGFTLIASFPGVPDATLPGNVPAFTIAPNATLTFEVDLNSATAGDSSGTVS